MTVTPRNDDEALDLNDSHRLWVAARTGHMRELLDELHRLGVSHELTANIEQQLEALERRTGARRSPPRRAYVLDATLSTLWIDACELRAKEMTGCGALGEREQQFFDTTAASLADSARQLRATIQLGS